MGTLKEHIVPRSIARPEFGPQRSACTTGRRRIPERRAGRSSIRKKATGSLMARLVYGTYEPTDRSHSIYMARLIFLEVIEKLAPQVLDDLSGEPLKAVLEMEPRPILMFDQKKGEVFSHVRDGPKMAKVEQLISNCLNKYQILTDWMGHLATTTVNEWAGNPDKRWPECRKERGPRDSRATLLINSVLAAWSISAPTIPLPRSA